MFYLNNKKGQLFNLFVNEGFFMFEFLFFSINSTKNFKKVISPLFIFVNFFV